MYISVCLRKNDRTLEFPLRILLAEDDSMLADATGRALTQTGHAVDKVKNGVDANAALSANQYDLVLLDIGLPKLDGFEVLKRLRSRGSTVPVLSMRLGGRSAKPSSTSTAPMIPKSEW